VEEVRLWANTVEKLWKRGYSLEAILQLRKGYSIEGKKEITSLFTIYPLEWIVNEKESYHYHFPSSRSRNNRQ